MEIKTLLIEDADLDARMIERLLKKSSREVFLIDRTKTLSDGLDLMGKNEYELILLDLGLPDSSGSGAVSRIHKAGDSNIIVVLTGLDSEEEAMQALSFGAQDYLVKDAIDVKTLQRVIRYARERLSRETELRRSNLELNLTVKTLKKAQAELVKSERLRALGQMASGVAHDFNNALAAISANTELLISSAAEGMPEEKKREMLNNILLLSQDASQVANRLGDFNKFSESTKDHEPVDLKELALNMVTITRPRWKDQAQLKGKTIEVELDLAENAEVMGNPAELREVLTNLIFNSIDAICKEGSIKFVLSCKKEQVVLEVSDTGVGMNKEQLKRCFEPFYTTKSADGYDSGGTGLGLSMVYGIIESHGATIEIKSKLNQGTGICMKFPKCDTGYSVNEVEQVLPLEVNSLKPSRVLLVDDELQIRKALGIFLKHLGFDCVLAEDGEEARKKFDSEHFDIVVTDRSMPEMNGDELSKYIKKKAPGIPVIMLTGYGEMMPKEKSVKPQVDQVLSKPCKVDVLKNTIDSLLSSRLA